MLFQFYKYHQTPHSIHSFPQPRSTTFYSARNRIENDISYEFRDQEREYYERQIEFERELDRERFVFQFIK